LIYHAGRSIGVSEESNDKVEFEVGFVLMIVMRNMFLSGVGNDEWCKVGHGVNNVGKHSLDVVDELVVRGWRNELVLESLARFMSHWGYSSDY
jgi:hypothetical protein